MKPEDAPVQKKDETSVASVITHHYAPAAFLLWATYGVFRPVFDPQASYSPIFWYVGGACLITLVGRWLTRDIEAEEVDETNDDAETLDDKWRFSLPGFGPAVRATHDAPRATHEKDD